VEQTAPFKLAKDPAKAPQLDEALYNLVEVCRILAVLLWPFLPGTSKRIYAQLGLPGAPEQFSEARWGVLAAGHTIGTPVALFPKHETV
jgi:methionyl-tRNA synthetase